MALPLDPQTEEMFPDTYVPPFVDAPEVGDLAFTLIEQWDELRALREAIESRVNPLAVAYVFDTRKLGDGEDLTVHAIVKPTKASPLWRHLSGHDVVIAFRQAIWNAIADGKRRAFLHHALSHIDVLGSKVALRDHPAEAFAWTYRRYGPLTIGESMLARAAALWNEDHPQEPTPLRAVDVTSPAFEEALRKEAPEGWEVARREDGTIVVNVDTDAPITPPKRRRDQALADAMANRIGTLVCQGSNHVPGHTSGCPRFGQS